MKTLYISDLDGTLLNKDAEVSEETKNILNKCLDKGLHFSIATARTHVTVQKILHGIKIKVPIILMNGVITYDIQNEKYININEISEKGKKALVDTISKHIKSGFLYCVDANNNLSTYYENTDSPSARAFVEERQRKYNKKFTKVNAFEECLPERVIYYSVDARKESLQEAYAELSKCDDLHIEFYRDIYNEDHWYLEVSATGSSKKNALLQLKESFGFDRIVSFGDNLNDLPMFEVSDECYAVRNAKDEVKQKAGGIIKSNTENGVAEFLKTQF